MGKASDAVADMKIMVDTNIRGPSNCTTRGVVGFGVVLITVHINKVAN